MQRYNIFKANPNISSKKKTSLTSPRFIADKSRICSPQIQDLLATIL